MKTIVNIVSEQTLPNYLFVREMYEKDDKIIWIVSKNERIKDAMQSLCNTLGNIPNEQIYLEEGKEENIHYINGILQREIARKDYFVVNLTGGTKPISLAAYDFFKTNCEKVDFFYIPFPKNIIVNLNTQEIKDIRYKIDIEEYLHLYNLKVEKKGEKEAYLSFEDAKLMFQKMNDLRNIYSTELKELRELKGKNRFKKNKSVASSFEVIKSIKLKEDKADESIERATRIQNFIENNAIPKKSEIGFISGEDITYITGGWFEDLVFYITKEIRKPDDIVCGVEILKKGDEKSKNELDVVYTKDNKLYIHECKTAWERGGMFNEIVYKATAIKSLFGLSIKSSIFSMMDKLSENNVEEKQHKETLQKMGVIYFGKKEIENEIDKLE